MRHFRIGLLAVLMLVLLRITIGWHFLHEGIWKLQNPSFSAEGFLRQSRGPLKDKFTALIPDYDGFERLDSTQTRTQWIEFRDKLADAFHFSEIQKERAAKAFNRYEARYTTYLDENQEDIARYIDGIRKLREKRGEPLHGIVAGTELPEKESDEAADEAKNEASVDRSPTGDTQPNEADSQPAKAEEAKASDVPASETPPRAFDPATREVPYLRDRLQKEESELRGMAAPWLAYIDQLDREYRDELRGLIDPDQKQRGQMPEQRTQLDQVDRWTSYGVAAIGLCLIVGLFTRLSSLAGAMFLLSVVLAQPAYPGVFPAPHPSAGHPLFVSKEVVELVAMLALATLPVGRWCGLDFIIHYGLVRPIFGRRKPHASDA
jgi:uncharacterized membrane protein YphA (DoxX/SURF4 family)